MYYFSDTSAANMNGVTGSTNAEHGEDTTGRGADILNYNTTTFSYSLSTQPFHPSNPTADIYPTYGESSQWQDVLDIDGDGDPDVLSYSSWCFSIFSSSLSACSSVSSRSRVGESITNCSSALRI